MTFFRLTHCYSNLEDKFFGVEVSCSEYELNLRCAYIQSIRDRLPLLSCVDAVINEKSCMLLLHEFYGIRISTIPRRYEKYIDLHQNWIDYCFASCNRFDSLNDYAVERASLKVLKLMYHEAKENLSAMKKSSSDEYILAVKEVNQLNAVIRGMSVSPIWGWSDINGHSLAGKQYCRSTTCEIVT